MKKKKVYWASVGVTDALWYRGLEEQRMEVFRTKEAAKKYGNNLRIIPVHITPIKPSKRKV